MSNILYLASSSKSRQILLNQAQIPFKLIEQTAKEDSFAWDPPLENIVQQIALLKMQYAILPNGQNNETCFVLTADTMGINSFGEICGKPKDKDDAIRMIKSYRQGAQTCTAFCLDKRIWQGNQWHTEDRIVESVCTNYIFDVPDHWIEKYFELSKKSGIDYMQVSGAVAVEDFGSQFLKTINGSFSTVAGLPLYELRLALEKLNFFNF